MFRFKAVDNAGAEVFGEIEAATEVEATRELKTRNLTVVDLAEIAQEVSPRVPRKASIQERGRHAHTTIIGP